MIDVADAVTQLLMSYEAILDEIDARIYGTALPATLTEGWTAGANGAAVGIVATIYVDDEETDTHATGDLCDTTARLAIIASDEDEAVRVAGVVKAALQPALEPTRRVQVGAYIFMGIHQTGGITVGDGQDTGWPQCEIKFAMSILMIPVTD